MSDSRIIHAPMNGRRYGVTAPITQYDYGYLLLPEGVELPTTYEVDFSNDEHKGTSLTVYGGAEGAEVPEELIRTGKDVFAFYYKVGDGYGKTDYTWRIPNHCRPDRDGGTPTPSQQSSIDQLIVRSNEAVEQAEQSASDASTSAQNASADAERAEEARTDAQNYADMAEQARDDAQTYANNASASATASANSASASAQIKADVEDLVDDAQASASASAQSADRAEQAANTAGWVDFYVDEDGYLHYVKADSTGLDFYVDNEGYLHVVMED